MKGGIIVGMENIEFGYIAIVAAAVSLLQQFLQSKDWSGLGKRLFTIGLSLVAACVYIFFKDTSFWVTFVSILVAASAVYAFVVKDLFPKE